MGFLLRTVWRRFITQKRRQKERSAAAEVTQILAAPRGCLRVSLEQRVIVVNFPYTLSILSNSACTITPSFSLSLFFSCLLFHSLSLSLSCSFNLPLFAPPLSLSLNNLQSVLPLPLHYPTIPTYLRSTYKKIKEKQQPDSPLI